MTARRAGLAMAATGLAVAVSAGLAAAAPGAAASDPVVVTGAASDGAGQVSEETPSPEVSESPSPEPSESPSEEPSEEVSEEPSEEVSEEPSEEPTSEGPVVEPDDPAPTISPTVLGVKVAKRPAAAPQGPALPETGVPAGTAAAAGLLLTLVGSGLVYGAGTYQRRH